MISLFLDTSSDNLYVSLIKNKSLLYEKIIKTYNDHSSYLVKTINESLITNKIKINQINKIYVVIGPGSFTGTRIGVTVAKTLAWALNIKVVPISSIKQYIFQYNDYDYYVPIIEEKNGLYFNIYNKNYDNIQEEKYIKKTDLNIYLSKLEGNILIISDNNYDGYTVKPKVINSVNIVNYYQNNDGINPHLLKPNYIKKIEAELKL